MSGDEFTMKFPKTTMEDAVKADLEMLPDAMQKGGVAAVALMCARSLDHAENLTPRDAAGFARELRLAMAQLREMAPGEVKGSVTDEIRERRERRLVGE